MKRLFVRLAMCLLLVAPSAFADALPVKVLVLAAFPPELTPWLKHMQHPSLLKVKGAYAPVWCDARAVCVTETGEGQVNSATTVAAMLGSDKLDMSGAIVLRAGIGGGPPWGNDTLGGAYWADWVVSWDLGHHLSAVSHGRPQPRFVPLRDARPPLGTKAFHLNTALVALAVKVTRKVPLADDATALSDRRLFPGQAHRHPNVAIGATITGDDFWSGVELSRLAQQMINIYTHGEAHYATTAMEETGDADAMVRYGLLSHYLSLRAISDFDQPPAGQTAAAMLLEHKYPGGRIAFENAYRVGHAFVEYVLKHPQVIAAAMSADRVPATQYPLTSAQALGH